MAGTVSPFRRNDCVHELFRTIERYDIKKLLKAASNSSLGVIFEEELHQLLKYKSKQLMREEFKRLILENDRLKNFVAFIMDYNGHVQKAAFAALQCESRLQLSPNIYTRSKGSCPPGPAAKSGNYSQESSSASSSNSRTPPSPMDVDNKDDNLISVAQETPDVGYCSATGPSSKDITTSNEYKYPQPIQGKTSILPIITVKRTTQSVDANLSQPTFEEHQTANGWPLQLKEHCYNSGSLFQDITCQGWAVEGFTQMAPKHRIRKKLPSSIEFETSFDGPVRPSFTDKNMEEYQLQPAADGWPPLLKQHFEVVMQNLSIEALLPQLLKNNLLTQSEYQELDCVKETSRKQNQYFLLIVLPRKGKNAFKVFLECLKAEKDHLGHQELAELLCNKN